MTVDGICDLCSADSGNTKVVIDGTTIGTCECADGFYKDKTGSCAKPCSPDTFKIPYCTKCATRSDNCIECDAASGGTAVIIDSGPIGKCECGLYLYKSTDHCVPCAEEVAG